jgi:predicted phage terminase large subunit-like protein
MKYDSHLYMSRQGTQLHAQIPAGLQCRIPGSRLARRAARFGKFAAAIGHTQSGRIRFRRMPRCGWERTFNERRVGDLLHPEYFSERAVNERRSQLDEKIFAAQYQQDPLQALGVMIKRDMIQRYNYLPIRKESHRVIQSWDTAIGVDASNDYSVCATLLVDEHRNYYLPEVLRDRLLYPELKVQAIAQAKKYSPDAILIEEAGLLGRTLVKDLKAAGLPAVGVVPEGDKLTRVSIQLEKFANRQMFFPEEAPWLVDFENELFAFPYGRYDDQVDALIQALNYKPRAEWNDAALEGLERFLLEMSGFPSKSLENFSFIPCFASRKFPVPMKTGNCAVSA